MYALVDCNAFFVSCERVFQPHLEGKPVIVLSSNDGCAIARSNEAKALGIQMGAPLFKIQNIVKKHRVHTFSANFSLYANMSVRVMETLKAFASSLEVYSIDEAFLDLRGIPQHELFSYGCQIKKIVKKWTGIPVSVGIAPTKTLAKVASQLAKQHPSGCYTLLSPATIEEALRDFPLQEVWGIGSKWSQKLSLLNMKSALDLAQADRHWMRKTFNICLNRTAYELRGISCLTLETSPSPKKSMISSRSFGVPVSSFEALREAVSFHTSSLAYKLRKQHNKTSLISVSIRSNPFDKQGNFYSNTSLISLPYPSHDTTLLIKAAASALETIFKQGISYKKAGVTVLNLSPEHHYQPSLFKDISPENTQKRDALFRTIDQINQQHGKRSVIFASEGLRKPWRPYASWRSPSFTQCWDQLMTVK